MGLCLGLFPCLAEKEKIYCMLYKQKLANLKRNLFQKNSFSVCPDFSTVVKLSIAAAAAAQIVQTK